MNPPDYENPINYDPETGKYLVVVPFMDRYTFLIILLVNSFLILVIMCGLLIFCLRKSDLNSSFFRDIQWLATCCGKYDKKNNNNRNARSNSIDLTILGGDLNNSSNPNNPSSSSNNPSSSSNNPSSNTNTESGNLRTQNSNPNNLDDNRNNNRVSNARTIATTPSHYYSIVSVDDED
ncbi:hypothetical protein NEIRO03_0063 [Nematocida sp. AWRm78]|nr:hypothetical protein NEIRO02_0122 [Nematocida sp. AWRm79]KAI5182379.1 hypothetical protein NEIRO03_0063 [Nematocida sp. AWRm78]